MTVLSMTRAGLLGEKCRIDPQTDWSKLFSISYRQGIINIIYRALKLSAADIPSDYLRLFQAEALKNIRTDYQQRAELKILFQRFEEEGIRYLPIKGILIKNLYPRPELRWMSDADIMQETEVLYTKVSSDTLIKMSHFTNRPGKSAGFRLRCILPH